MEKAYDFKLSGISPDGEEREFTLNEFLNKGKKVILYFYPKDNTSGWTTEARDFSSKIPEIKDKAFVIGISPDSIKSHKNFMQKHDLKIYLLSNPEKDIIEKYGAYGEKKMYGKVKKGVIRSTFLIDEDGKIIYSWKNVRVKGHVDKVIEKLNEFS